MYVYIYIYIFLLFKNKSQRWNNTASTVVLFVDFVSVVPSANKNNKRKDRKVNKHAFRILFLGFCCCCSFAVQMCPPYNRRFEISYRLLAITPLSKKNLPGVLKYCAQYVTDRRTFSARSAAADSRGSRSTIYLTAVDRERDGGISFIAGYTHTGNYK